MLNIKIFIFKILTSIWFKLIVAGTIIFFLFYFNRIDYKALAHINDNWKWMLLAFICTIPPIWIVTFRFKVILASQGVIVTFYQALQWTMIGSFFDLAMPSSNGGDVVKASYLINHVGSGYKTIAVMAVAFDRIIGVLGLFLLAFLASLIGWNVLSDFPYRNLLLII